MSFYIFICASHLKQDLFSPSRMYVFWRRDVSYGYDQFCKHFTLFVMWRLVELVKKKSLTMSHGAIHLCKKHFSFNFVSVAAILLVFENELTCSI